MNLLLERGESLILVGVESDFAPDVLDSVARIGAEVKGTVALQREIGITAGSNRFNRMISPANFSGTLFCHQKQSGIAKAESIAG